ncbi:MAG: hypothetical protein OEY14_10365, partial [Myxococcales bacterium]|nr:hypothetical protein [Myxococcales bacterium]
MIQPARISVLLGAWIGLLLSAGCSAGSSLDAGVEAGSEASVDSAASEAGPGDAAAPSCAPTCGPSESCCPSADPSMAPSCVRLEDDPRNCGLCGLDCASGFGTECSLGRCVCGFADIGCLGTRRSTCCPPRAPDGTPYCANLDGDARDCGACGTRCDAASADHCEGGRCVCGGPRGACAGTPEDTCCG